MEVTHNLVFQTAQNYTVSSITQPLRLVTNVHLDVMSVLTLLSVQVANMDSICKNQKLTLVI